MSSRPYWGLYELDFVFSTLVVRVVKCAVMKARMPCVMLQHTSVSMPQLLNTEDTHIL